jgi:hypothetical protein
MCCPALPIRRGVRPWATTSMYLASMPPADWIGIAKACLLLTSDGALAHRITDPEHHLPKIYLVQVERIPDAAAVERLQQGVVVGGRRTKPARARLLLEAPSDPGAAGAHSIPEACAHRMAGAHAARRHESPGSTDDGSGGPSDLATGAGCDRPDYSWGRSCPVSGENLRKQRQLRFMVIPERGVPDGRALTRIIHECSREASETSLAGREDRTPEQVFMNSPG